MGSVRSILIVVGRPGLSLGFGLGGVKERAKRGLALAGRFPDPGWGLVRALDERARPPVLPSVVSLTKY